MGTSLHDVLYTKYGYIITRCPVNTKYGYVITPVNAKYGYVYTCRVDTKRRYVITMSCKHKIWVRRYGYVTRLSNTKYGYVRYTMSCRHKVWVRPLHDVASNGCGHYTMEFLYTKYGYVITRCPVDTKDRYFNMSCRWVRTPVDTTYGYVYMMSIDTMYGYVVTRCPEDTTYGYVDM